jgi:uncharacterized membrane protein YdbT with pleckstrin-like domain
MYCIHCGADNLESAKYCRKCGKPVSDDTETVVVSRSVTAAAIDHHKGDETTVFKISPTLMFVKIGYAAAAIAALFLVASFSAFTSVSLLIAVAIGLLLLLVPGYYHLRQRMITYTLTDSKLEVDTGLVARTTRSVPIRRIQDVTVSTNVWQRLFGFGDLVIDNASEEGGKAVLKNINSPKRYADMLLKQMRQIGGGGE